MTLKYVRIVALLLALPLFIDSCGKKKDKNEEDGGGGNGNDDQNLAPKIYFIGKWTGQYQALKDGKDDGALSSIEAEFSENGRFKFVLTDNTTAYTEGLWTEHGGQLLQMKITKSTISQIGWSNTNIAPTYQRAGSSATISNEKFRLTLNRLEENNTGNANGTGTPSGPVGLWNCSGGGRNTELNIGDNQRWRATIKTDESGMLLVSGSMKVDNGTYILNIESSMPQVKPGSKLGFALQSNTEATLESIPTTGTAQSLGTCHR